MALVQSYNLCAWRYGVCDDEGQVVEAYVSAV